MTSYIKIVIYLISLMVLNSCVIGKRGVSEQYAKDKIDDVIKLDSNEYDGKLIAKYKSRKIAKKKIYNTYGYWNVSIHQKPYRKFYINRFLYLSGSIAKNRKGGVFTIIVDRSDGEILYISHGK